MQPGLTRLVLVCGRRDRDSGTPVSWVFKVNAIVFSVVTR